MSQISLPEPLMVNCPDAYEALPRTLTFPTSRFCQGDGKGGAGAVVNDQTGPAVDPPLFVATTCQKYVMAKARAGGLYEAAVSPVAATGGGLAVPKFTL